MMHELVTMVAGGQSGKCRGGRVGSAEGQSGECRGAECGVLGGREGVPGGRRGSAGGRGGIHPTSWIDSSRTCNSVLLFFAPS